MTVSKLPHLSKSSTLLLKKKKKKKFRAQLIAFLFISLFFSVPCGFSIPQAETEPGPQQWKAGILTTRQPGNSQAFLLS